MLQPGWTDRTKSGVMRRRSIAGRAACRTLWLLTGTIIMGGCSLLGGGGAGPAGGQDGTAAPVTAPSPEIEARYAGLVGELRSDDAATVAAAVNGLEALSREHPDLAGPMFNLGLVRVRAGDPAGALAWFDKAAAVCSRCGPVWNEIGVVNTHEGRFADAEKAYRRAIELAPDYATAYYNIAILYELYIPRPELAVQNYEKYLQLGGDGREVEKWLVDLRRRVNDVPKAARADGSS